MKMVKFSNIVILLSVLVCKSSSDCEQSALPELTFRLAGTNIQWPCQSTQNIYVTSGRYTPRNIIITRAQLHKDEAFLALPRYKPGVPFSLGRINLRKGECFAPIAPYPSWSMQEEGNCQALQSVVDLFLDNHDILWVLDVGVVNTLEQPARRCSPKVVAIDIRTGQIVKIIDLSNVITSDSRLQYIVVDYDDEGRSYIYISDAGTRAIIVHDTKLNRSYRIVLPTAVTIGCKRNDVLYIALVRKSCGMKVLYFTYLGSTRLFSIKTEHLRRGQGSGAVVDVGPKPYDKQIVLLGSDNGAALFLRYKGESDIYLWNTETLFKGSNFLEVQRGGECRLPTQVIPGYKRFMWTLESNFQDFIANTVGCSGASTILHPVVRESEN